MRCITFLILALMTVVYSGCKKDECKDVTCLNGGQCNSGKCDCPSGYEGDKCETKTNEKFAGIYVGNETCSFWRTGSVAVSIAPKTDPLNILINYGGELLNATINGNSISIPNQIGSDGWQWNGNGSLNNNTLNLTVTDSYMTSVNVCTFVGTK